MATDVERLIVALEARTKAFENALNKANGVANKRATAIERRFQAMNRNMASGFNAAAGAAARAFAIIGSCRKQMARSTWARIHTRSPRRPNARRLRSWHATESRRSSSATTASRRLR